MSFSGPEDNGVVKNSGERFGEPVGRDRRVKGEEADKGELGTHEMGVIYLGEGFESQGRGNSPGGGAHISCPQLPVGGKARTQGQR